MAAARTRSSFAANLLQFVVLVVAHKLTQGRLIDFVKTVAQPFTFRAFKRKVRAIMLSQGSDQGIAVLTAYLAVLIAVSFKGHGVSSFSRPTPMPNSNSRHSSRGCCAAAPTKRKRRGSVTRPDTMRRWSVRSQICGGPTCGTPFRGRRSSVDGRPRGRRLRVNPDTKNLAYAVCKLPDCSYRQASFGWRTTSTSSPTAPKRSQARRIASRPVSPLGNSTLDAPVPPKRKPDASTRAMSPKEGTTSWTRTPSRGSGRRIRKTSRYGNKETSDNNGVVE
jgi:hypothetical protein